MPFLTDKSCTILSILCFALIASGSTHSAIYKWVDEEGKTHYGERPVSQTAEKLDIKTRTPIPPPAKDAAADDGKSKDNTDEKDASKEKAVEPPKKDKPPQITPQEKRARCKAAKQRMTTISQSGRLKSYDSEGNMVRLTDEQRQATIKEVRKNIRKYCR